MADAITIYCIIDPETSHIRYIGKTNDFTRRKWQHRYYAVNKHGQTYKDRWLRNIFSKGLTPIFQIIDEVPVESWQEYEKYYIEIFRQYEKSFGYLITNLTDGGEGMCGHTIPRTQQHIENLRRARKGKGHPISEETKQKISLANKGKTRTSETRKKIGEVSRGRKISEETRAKLRAAVARRIASPDFYERWSKKMKEVRNRPEEREKASQTTRKLWSSPEYREKITGGWDKRRARGVK
jgi:hypothetical protein